MPRMSGGQALVRSLVREGVEVVFGLPGVQMYGIIAALRDEPGIRMITTRHEGATTYMADGYARAGGRVGVAMVVPGPGIYNAGGGLSTAYSASSPVLMIAGQIPRDGIGKNVGGLHEVDDQIDTIKPVTKWQKRMLYPGEIPAGVHEAFRQLRNGRPRPVEIELPPDAMVEVDDIDLLEPAPAERQVARGPDIQAAADMLMTASSPVIYAGGGVHLADAHPELRALAEALDVPVVTSAAGKGAISDHHPLSLGASLGPVGKVRDLVNDADVVLAVGTRFAMAGPRPETTVIQIDIDPDEIGRNHKKTVPLQGHIKPTLSALTKAISSNGKGNRSSASLVREARQSLEGPEERNDPQDSILRSLRKGTPEDAVMVFGMTQLGYYSRPFWPTYHPRTYLDSGYSGNLGYAYPFALGAKVAQPDKPVVSVSGDGGFMYYSGEIATAAKYGINVVAVVFNDNAFGNVARDLDQDFGGQYEAAVHNPDFMKLADAYGVTGMRADEPTDVGDLVARAIDMDRPVLIEVPVSRMPRPKIWSRRAAWTKPQE
ncbi:MAG: thiamine pyrophosphate-dependent enzyme [Dehalococcoidia bacterium]